MDWTSGSSLGLIEGYLEAFLIVTAEIEAAMHRTAPITENYQNVSDAKLENPGIRLY